MKKALCKGKMQDIGKGLTVPTIHRAKGVVAKVERV